MKRIFGVANAKPVRKFDEDIRVTVIEAPDGVVISVQGYPALLSWEQGRHIAQSILKILGDQDCPSCKQPWSTCPCEPAEL
jgi:hypothetical protein